MICQRDFNTAELCEAMCKWLVDNPTLRDGAIESLADLCVKLENPKHKHHVLLDDMCERLEYVLSLPFVGAQVHCQGEVWDSPDREPSIGTVREMVTGKARVVNIVPDAVEACVRSERWYDIDALVLV